MTSRLTIDLDALGHNHAALKRQAGAAEVAPVIKADGYGLGAGPIARRLWAEGARSFFVARLEEGESLRRQLGARSTDILVLDGPQAQTVERFAAARLTPVLNSPAQARLWGRPGVLHVDTGMNRLGLSPDEASELAASGYAPTLVMSHLGSAAEPNHPRNAVQLERFQTALALFPEAKASLSASAGMFLGDDYLFEMVRPGISLFGGGPLETPDPRLKAVTTLTAPVLQLRGLKAGETAGYGSAFTASRDMRIAILGCGYADGIIRACRGKGMAWTDDAPVPIAFVTMDLIAVDVSDAGPVQLGDEIELLGPRAQLDDLAAAAGSVAHECLVRLGSRGERVYVGEAD